LGITRRKFLRKCWRVENFEVEEQSFSYVVICSSIPFISSLACNTVPWHSQDPE
jgi:hypothetical protein